VSARGEATEDLVQVEFRAASLRILPVLPVDDEELQRRPIRRASASSTPLTKRALVALP
jgi:hypothetical protein